MSDKLVEYIKDMKDDELPSYQPYFYFRIVPVGNDSDDLLSVKHKYFKNKRDLDVFAKNFRIKLIKEGYSIIQVSKYNPLHTKLTIEKNGIPIAFIFESH